MWRHHKLTPNAERDHRHVSVIAGLCWKSLTPDQQLRYHNLAEEEKKRHIRENPNYKYSPVSRRQKSAKRRVRNDNHDKERCKKVASLMMKGFEGPALEIAVKNEYQDAHSDSPAHDTPVSTPLASSTMHTPRQPSSVKPVYKEETATPVIKIESPDTPVLNCDFSPSCQDFVPTSEIPPLDLSAPISVTAVRA